MSRLFIHRPVYRIISPVISGAIVYLLILLINNNVSALEALFTGQELYFCIGLSYLTHEFSRIIILQLSEKGILKPSLQGILITVIACSLTIILLVTGCIYLYFENVLGYSPILSELITFNAVFIVISWIHISLFIAHDVLRQSHSLRIKQEMEYKHRLEEEFIQYKEGINPGLLFESLEQLLVLTKSDPARSEEFLDHLASVYRYVLASKQELVKIQDELAVLRSLVALFNELPNRIIRITVPEMENFLLVPGALLKIIETCIRMAIASPDNPLIITLQENGHLLQIRAEFTDRILLSGKPDELIHQLDTSYQLYADDHVTYNSEENIHIYTLPKLMLSDERADH